MTEQERIEKFYSISPLSFDDTKALVGHLRDMGFFKAPASTKYHGNHEGGLFEHSLQMWHHLSRLTDHAFLNWQRNYISVFLVSMLHDICKCDAYLFTDPGWEYNKNTLLTGHGEKSAMLAALCPVKLTEEELVCIRYHMGAFVEKEEWGAYTNAIHKYPNVLWTHTADMLAAHVDMT